MSRGDALKGYVGVLQINCEEGSPGCTSESAQTIYRLAMYVTYSAAGARMGVFQE